MSPREQLIPSDNWTWIPCDSTDAEMIVNISMSGADLKRTEITIPLRKQFGDEVIAINDIWKKEWNLSLFSEIWDGEYDGGSRDITLQYIDSLGLHLSARRSSGDETIDTRLVVPYKTYYHRKVGTIEYRSKWKTKEAEHAPPAGRGEAPRP